MEERMAEMKNLLSAGSIAANRRRIPYE